MYAVLALENWAIKDLVEKGTGATETTRDGVLVGDAAQDVDETGCECMGVSRSA